MPTPSSHRRTNAAPRHRRRPPPSPSLFSPTLALDCLLFSAFVTLHVGYQLYLLALRLVTWKYTEPSHVALLSSLRLASALSSSKRSLQGLTTTEVTLPGAKRTVSYRIPSHLALVLAPPPEARLRHLLLPPALAAASVPVEQKRHSQRQRRLDADLVVQLRELIRWSSIVRIDTLSALDPNGRLKELLAERFGEGQGAEWIIEWESSENEGPVDTARKSLETAADGAPPRLFKRPSFHRAGGGAAAAAEAGPSSGASSPQLEDDDDDDDDGDGDIFMTPSLDSVASFHTPMLSSHVSRSVASLRVDEDDAESAGSSSSSSSSSRGSAESLLIKDGSTGDEARRRRGRRDRRGSASTEGMRSPTSNSATSPASSRSASRSRASSDEATEDKKRRVPGVATSATALLWERWRSGKAGIDEMTSRWWGSQTAARGREGKSTRWRVRAKLHFPPSPAAAAAAAGQETSEVLPLPPVDEEMSIDVWLFGPEDGKGMMRGAAQSLLDERCKGSMAAQEINVGTVDKRLRDLSHLPPTDPELLLLHGGTRDVQALATFPAWPLRLTEIFYDEEADMRRNVELRSFLGALKRFARAEQRFGK